MPEWLVLTLAMLAACAVVVVITLIRHSAAPEDEDPSETPDVIEYMTMWIGVVYAIVLGLAIAGVWEARSAAQDHVQAEAQALHEISERVRVYPADARDRIRDDVNAYVGHVVTTEWKEMADHRRGDRARHRAPRPGPHGRHRLRAEDRLRGPGLPAAPRPGGRGGPGPQRPRGLGRADHAGRGLVRSAGRRPSSPSA